MRVEGFRGLLVWDLGFGIYPQRPKTYFSYGHSNFYSGVDSKQVIWQLKVGGLGFSVKDFGLRAKGVRGCKAFRFRVGGLGLRLH